MLARVKWLKTVVALMLLALWMPATSLCLIERAGWFANDNCCPSSSQSAPNSQSSGEATCCALASATYEANNNQTVAVASPIVAFLVLWDLTAVVEELNTPQSVSLSPSPPDLPVTWQFSLRTALPPRAPSFVS
jgi:hypothetical protein